MRSFTVPHSTAPHSQPRMDTMIGVGAALAIIENSTDAELAPALLQRPALTDRLRSLVGATQSVATTPPSSATAPQTQPTPAPPATASACAGVDPAEQAMPAMQSPVTAVPAFGGGQIYMHSVPAWSVPAAPAQAQQAPPLTLTTAPLKGPC